MYKDEDGNPKTPKCEECIPILMSGNRQIFEIYTLIRNQHIMGFGGPVDLDFKSAMLIIDMFGVDDKKEVFDKVYRLYNITLSRIRDRIESSSPDIGQPPPQLDPRLRKFLK